MWTLTEEQRIGRDAFARMLSSTVVPDIQAANHPEQLPEADLRRQLLACAPYGLGRFRIPAEFGGLGLDLVTTGVMHETASRLVPELSTPALINDGVGLLLSRSASKWIKRDYLAPLAAGERIAASANTEATGGSDVSAVATRACRSGAGYRISGRKVWITNGQYADFAVVLARTEETGLLDLFLVDRETHGFDVSPLALAGRVTAAELNFDDVEVPYESRLTDRDGLSTMLAAFQATRALVALSAVGVGQAAFDLGLAYAKDRQQFGRPIAATQLIQAQLADSVIDLDAARLLAYRALATADRGEPVELEASMAKLFASEAAQRVVYRAQQIHGAAGLNADMPIEHLSRLVRVYPIVEGASEIQRLIIGRKLTGMNAF